MRGAGGKLSCSRLVLFVGSACLHSRAFGMQMLNGPLSPHRQDAILPCGSLLSKATLLRPVSFERCPLEQPSVRFLWTTTPGGRGKLGPCRRASRVPVASGFATPSVPSGVARCDAGALHRWSKPALGVLFGDDRALVKRALVHLCVPVVAVLARGWHSRVARGAVDVDSFSWLCGWA